MHEFVDPRLDDRLGLGHRRLPAVLTGADDFAEVVDGVQENVVELADFGFDVARHRQIDHEHRPMLALLDRAFNHAKADDGQRAGRGGDDDVEVGEQFRQVGQRRRLAAEFVGQVAGAFDGAVDHHQPARFARGKVGGDQVDHFAGADEQHGLIGDRRENAFRQGDGGG